MKPKDLGPFQEIEVANLTKDILTGLEYVHEQGYIHRDLKGFYSFSFSFSSFFFKLITIL